MDHFLKHVPDTGASASVLVGQKHVLIPLLAGSGKIGADKHRRCSCGVRLESARHLQVTLSS